MVQKDQVVICDIRAVIPIEPCKSVLILLKVQQSTVLKVKIFIINIDHSFMMLNFIVIDSAILNKKLLDDKFFWIIVII